MYWKLITVIFYLSLHHNVFGNLREGQTCDLKNGEKGVCKRLSKCPYALKEFKELKLTKLQFCSTNFWKPIVCCVDCSFLGDLLHNDNFLLEGYGTANEICLKQFYRPYPCNWLGDEFAILDNDVTCYSNPLEWTPAAAGGIDAMRDEFPHMALIGYGNEPETADWMCGGTVITDRFILTAAHCISSPGLGRIKFAALGILKRTDHPNLWQKYDIVRIISHPGYSPPSKYHDIALLATGAKIRFNRRVIPACLHRGNDLADVALATGWGTLGHRKPLADHLQVVVLNKFSRMECSQAYPKHRHLKHGVNSTSQVCYGDKDKINDTCQGDSGGPLQIKSEGEQATKCLYTIIGVTSYGKACGYIGSAGIYTRVNHYIPWIESITGKLP